MEDKNLKALQDIQEMMAKSSRFISLSGLSGVAAGLCALIGAFFANRSIQNYFHHYSIGANRPTALRDKLLLIGLLVFFSAITSAYLFTLRKSKKDNTPIWGTTSMRLLWNTFLPIAAGGLFILKLISLKFYTLVAPTCLMFYGLGLINGSKYTLSEIRYLGYAQIILSVANLWLPHYGLIFWTLGFGVLHIVYGLFMWNKYERQQLAD